jgi:hypothetical protein
MKWRIPLLQYAALATSGLVLVALCGFIQQVNLAPPGEYRFSEFLRSSYTFLCGFAFFIAGLAAGYTMRLNPWLTGLSLISIFPLTSLAEATIYRGSHNLIPFELVVHFLFALPAIGGAYLGGLLEGRMRKHRQHSN